MLGWFEAVLDWFIFSSGLISIFGVWLFDWSDWLSLRVVWFETASGWFVAKLDLFIAAGICSIESFDWLAPKV